MTATSSEGAPLRVAFLVKSLPVMPWVADQVRGLEARGVTVNVLGTQRVAGGPSTPGTTGDFAAARVLSVGRRGAALEVAREAARALFTSPAAALGVLGRYRPGSGALQTRLALAVVASRADIVHAHFGNFTASILSVQRLTALPLIVSFYGWDASAAPRKQAGMYDALFRAAAHVVVLSDEMRMTLIDLGCPEDKLRIVHISVAIDDLIAEAGAAPGRELAAASANGTFRILAVGRLVEKKGLDDALDAVALLHRRNVPFVFRIVGDGPLRTELGEQARRLGLSSRVEFRGSLSREDVFREMRWADVFFLPSRESRAGDREGTPTVLIEAGALGIPCLATRHAGTPEIVKDNESGLLNDERDVEGLAVSLEALARDPELRRRLGTGARRHIEAEFELESQCAVLEQVYRGCRPGRTAGSSL